MKFLHLNSVICTIFLISICFTSPVSAQVYNAELDFSATSNPNGVWQYGYKTTLTGSFIPMLQATSSVFGVEGWNINGSDMINTAPFVMHNFTGGVVNITSVHMPNNVLNLHPGPLGQNAVVRWTVPASGLYSLNGFFQGIDDNTTTDDHIILNNATSLFSDNINGFNDVKNFGLVQNLQTGDTVDFSVGVGSNGTYFGDSTGFNAQMQIIPEPPSFAYLLGVLFMAPVLVRRRSNLGDN
jgi:hypothetical protein